MAEPTFLQAVPILVYHRFADRAVDSMSIRRSLFAAHLETIHRLGAQVIPLSDWVAYRRGELKQLPARALVLTVDDGHLSQYQVMAPLLQEASQRTGAAWPITLFIYPSAISKASYAMSWAQLRELSRQPGFSLQSHSYWHPNFVQERRRLDPAAFDRFARQQLQRSRGVLQDKLGTAVTQLAWPFGLSDAGLHALAEELGYHAAFGLSNRAATLQSPQFDAPRYLTLDSVSERALAVWLKQAFQASQIDQEKPT
ncbi:polysaccharide deacetylase family protein [Roseateles sp.]|uniref:polysaccharide deacetylase family protein n=1 Tax=Roseateles sp. TaxID=1971397 RepID=UPI003BA719EC